MGWTNKTPANKEADDRCRRGVQIIQVDRRNDTGTMYQWYWRQRRKRSTVRQSLTSSLLLQPSVPPISPLPTLRQACDRSKTHLFWNWPGKLLQHEVLPESDIPLASFQCCLSPTLAPSSRCEESRRNKRHAQKKSGRKQVGMVLALRSRETG